jgi:endonuclease/exonuclease/phosphatase family metal-dependent hydrolase
MNINNSENNNSMDKLKVLSWNVRHCKKDDGTIDVFAFMHEITKADVDVVLLQEVDRGAKRSQGIDQVIAFRNALGAGWTPVFSKRLDMSPGSYGLAALSKLPITEAKSYLLSDLKKEKCILQEIVIEFAGSPVKIYNIHMPAGKGNHAHKAWKQLMRVPTDGDCIFGGDFNSPNHNLNECVDIGVKDTHCNEGRIDYCVSSGNIVPVEQVVIPRNLSDHYPIITTFAKTFES